MPAHPKRKGNVTDQALAFLHNAVNLLKQETIAIRENLGWVSTVQGRVEMEVKNAFENVSRLCEERIKNVGQEMKTEIF